MSRVVAKGVHAARAPYGLRRVYQGRDVGWELDPIEAPIVREMYRLSVEENRGYKAIADRLTEAGHLARGGRPFASHTIQRILSNEALVGTLSYGKRPRKGNPQIDVVRVPEFFPAILSGEEWQLLQERLAIRRESNRGKVHTSPYLLSGIVKCGNCGGPMVGKTGMMWRGQRYRNYYCSWAMRSRGLCSTYNGNSARKLEASILEYLERFSDPELVREHMATAARKEIDGRQKELRGVERGLAELESRFLKHLDLLRRGVLSEEEFVKANESMRSQKPALEDRRVELESWLAEQRSRVSAAKRMPDAIRTFLEDFRDMDIRVQKAHLQTILKAAHVYREGRLESSVYGAMGRCHSRFHWSLK